MCQGIKKRCFTPATIFKSPEDSRFVRADALAMGDKVLNREHERRRSRGRVQGASRSFSELDFPDFVWASARKV